MSKNRDDFTKDTRSRLAKRAGYLCSFCGVLTVGPSDEKESAVNLTGIAAHICGAASGPGSRRYRKDMTSQERKSITNGIWLCATDADLIDGDEILFTEEQLKELKKKHEEKIKYKHSGLPVEKGLFVKFEISNFGKFLTTQSFSLGKNNLIVGNNTTGKTIICEFFAALSNKNYLSRWKRKRNEGNSHVKIDFFKTELLSYTISVNYKKEINYKLNHFDTPIIIPPAHIFFLDKNFWKFIHSYDSEPKYFIKYIYDYFKLTEDEFINIIKSTSSSKKYFVFDILYFEDKNSLNVKMGPKSPLLSFQALSGGEQYRVLIEIAIQLAVFYSKFNSTLLIIEQSAFGSIDTAGINKIIDIVSSNSFDFQFILTIYENKKHYNWEKLNTYELLEVSETNVDIIKL